MGWEPKEEELPIDPSTLSLEAQQSLIVLNSLPDNWDGMSGVWLGKDYSGLSAIMDIYDIDNKREVFELMKVAENILGKHYEELRKQRESLNKSNTKRA